VRGGSPFSIFFCVYEFCRGGSVFALLFVWLSFAEREGWLSALVFFLCVFEFCRVRCDPAFQCFCVSVFFRVRGFQSDHERWLRVFNFLCF